LRRRALLGLLQTAPPAFAGEDGPGVWAVLSIATRTQGGEGRKARGCEGKIGAPDLTSTSVKTPRAPTPDA